MRRCLLTALIVLCCMTTPPRRAHAQEGPADAAAAEAQATLLGDYIHSAVLLYRAAAAEPGNVVVAPHTVHNALAMLYAGARNASARQLADALQWHLDAVALATAHQHVQDTMLQDATRNSNTIVRTASRLWVREGLTVEPAYATLLARHFGTSVGMADFARHPAEACHTINSWVAGQTRDLVTNLIGPDAVDASTSLVQTAAMYLKANWMIPFDVEPEPAVFHAADGTVQNATMLQSVAGANFRYAATSDVQAVEIMYEGAGLAMDVILPQAPLSQWERSLDANFLQALAQAWGPRQVLLRWPKFGFETPQNVSTVLQRLGAHDLFDARRADLSGIFASGSLYVNAAVSKAKISVDENGTEAAAATAIILAPASASPDDAGPVEFTVDRPFMFVIRDVQQNLILFMGRVEHL